nr:immunoglobulin light chain junction region [Macaca mulatta]MOX53329.1 immunoglobulin light chain junction region [Macaca mulatta]MOX57338.1 immunoglobulin light chain junction region [Macaca mulatta]MOX58047.1 immunoglobulin light chain junction region [Macaca mulatta]MOX58089.1 immunoglobulin light chain junction region [Macaca mulatta]
CQQGHSIPYSF